MIIPTSLITAVDSGFEACPSAGLGLGAILLLVLLAGTVLSAIICKCNYFL